MDNPDTAEEWNNLGLEYLKKAQYKEAIDACETAQKINPELPINPLYADAWNIRGTLYLIRGEFVEALKNFDRALEIDPDFKLSKINREVTLRHLGLTFTNIQSEKESLQPPPTFPSKSKSILIKNLEMQKAEYTDPGSSKNEEKDTHLSDHIASKKHQLRIDYCKSLLRSERYQDAILQCETLLVSSPKESLLWIIKGNSHIKLLQFEEAFVAFNTVLSYDPANFVVKSRLASMNVLIKDLFGKDMAYENLNEKFYFFKNGGYDSNLFSPEKNPEEKTEITIQKHSITSNGHLINSLYDIKMPGQHSVPETIIKKSENHEPNSIESRNQDQSETTINSGIRCIIFDLDQTLVDASQLKSFRDAGNWNSAIGNIKTLKHNPQIDNLLINLLSIGIKVGCVTSAPREYAIKIIQHFGWKIDVVVSYHDTIKHKPDPEPFIRVLSVLQIDPKECVAVGDEIIDAIAAKAAGINPISINWFDQIHSGSTESDGIFQTIGEFTKYCNTISPQDVADKIPKSTLSDNNIPLDEELKTSSLSEQNAKIFHIFKNLERDHYQGVNTLGKYYPLLSPKHDELSANIWLMKIIDDHNEKGIALQNPERMQRQIEEFATSIISLLNPNPELVVCVLPKSSRNREPGGIRQVAEKMCERNFTDGTKVIERIKDRPPYHFGGNRDYKREVASLGITNTDVIRGKIILLLDDVSTTGNSFAAAKMLLLSHGAKQIIPFALGKTSK